MFKTLLKKFIMGYFVSNLSYINSLMMFIIVFKISVLRILFTLEYVSGSGRFKEVKFI